MIISPGVFFFHFFKILNNKRFCLSRSISQEPYIMWLPFMVRMCKMIISPGVFSYFKILIFWIVRGPERATNGTKWQKFLSVAPYISGTIYHMISISGAHQGLKNWKFGCTFFHVCQYRFAYMLCTQPISWMWITCTCTRVCRSCTPLCTWLSTLHKYFPSVVLSYLILH